MSLRKKFWIRKKSWCK